MDERYGVCYGTKEREECSCEGDQSKCDFYPEKREKCTFDEKGDEKEMNTALMWLSAQTDGKVYKSGDMRYSKEKGFHDRNGAKWKPDAFYSIENIMLCQWAEFKGMTRAEAEKALGVEIID